MQEGDVTPAFPLLVADASGVERLVPAGWPAFEQSTAPVDGGEAFHLPGAGVEIALEDLDRVIDFAIRVAIAGKLVRADHHPHAMQAVLDLEFTKDARHVRLRDLADQQ